MAKTSPRTTQLLHERCDLTRLANVGSIFHQAAGLGGKPGALAVALGRLRDRTTSCLSTGDPSSPGDLIESTEPVRAKAQRERR